MQIYPTLVVGIGGTGCKIAKRLKRTLKRQCDGDLHVRFLGIDTDLAEQEARNQHEDGLDHFVPIGGQPVHLNPGDAAFKPIMDWLPVDKQGKPKVDLSSLGRGQGAGGHRLLGRFAYNYFAPPQFQAIERTIADLIDLAQNPLPLGDRSVHFSYKPGLAVYFISSLVGGTGSGAFLDVIATIHELTDRALHDQQRFFKGYFLLPSVFDFRSIRSQGATHQATAYACLKDLDLLLTRPGDQELNSFWFLDQPQPFILKEGLLDNAFLVDRFSGVGALTSDDEVYSLVATHLFAAIGTPAGAHCSSVENNCDRFATADPEGGMNHYSAFGLAGLDYSQSLLRCYCASSLAVAAIDSLLGEDMPDEAAQADAAAFLQQVGLSGGRNCRVGQFISGDSARFFHRSEDDVDAVRPADLERELAKGYQDFRAALDTGSVRSTLQQNYRNQLLSRPDTARADVRPGQAAPVQPQMWRHRVGVHLEETVRKSGLRAGLRVARAMRGGLEGSYQDFETGLGDLRNNAQSAKTAFDDALERLRRITPAVAIFRRGETRQLRKEAAHRRNELVSADVAVAAGELGTRAFNDDTDGVIPGLGRAISQLEQVTAVLQSVRAELAEGANAIQTDREDAQSELDAVESSKLLYDVLPGHAFPQFMVNHLPDKTGELVAAVLQGKSALRLLEDLKPEESGAAVKSRLLHQAEALCAEATDRHVLEVITDGAAQPEERRTRIARYLGDAASRLSSFAPVERRPGTGATYDFCVALYNPPADTQLNDAFKDAASLVARHLQVPVETVPGSGDNSRILLTRMQHGYALNSAAFMELDRWRSAYESLKERDNFLDVDRRWSRFAGPGQKQAGAARDRIFTLGLAFGLITQQGDLYYSNFKPALVTHDARKADTRDQYDVDIDRVQTAISEAKNPVEWFAALTRGPSQNPTIPVQFGGSLGSDTRFEQRDRIGQGREQSFQAFAHDEGEDYRDVADAIAAVVEAYAHERGRAAVREELAWYREALQQKRSTSAQLRDQLQREIDLVAELDSELAEDGRFDLPMSR